MGGFNMLKLSPTTNLAMGLIVVICGLVTAPALDKLMSKERDNVVPYKTAEQQQLASEKTGAIIQHHITRGAELAQKAKVTGEANTRKLFKQYGGDRYVFVSYKDSKRITYTDDGVEKTTTLYNIKQKLGVK